MSLSVGTLWNQWNRLRTRKNKRSADRSTLQWFQISRRIVRCSRSAKSIESTSSGSDQSFAWTRINFLVFFIYSDLKSDLNSNRNTVDWSSRSFFRCFSRFFARFSIFFFSSVRFDPWIFKTRRKFNFFFRSVKKCFDWRTIPKRLLSMKCAIPPSYQNYLNQMKVTTSLSFILQWFDSSGLNERTFPRRNNQWKALRYTEFYGVRPSICWTWHPNIEYHEKTDTVISFTDFYRRRKLRPFRWLVSRAVFLDLG